jgi:uncharacterized protein (TIGR04255 family)
MEVLVFDFLPAVQAIELSEAPLTQVVAQVRFNSQSALSTHAGAIKFQEPLLDHYPRLLAESQATITAAPGNVSSATIPQWRLTDLEGGWACVVGPEHLTIETSAYSTWPLLRDRLVAALDVLTDVAAPRVRERIGLRYVNHIPRDTEHGYIERVDSSLLGVVERPGWREQLAVSLSQVVVRDGSTQLTVRYGRGEGVPGLPTDAFVIDIDCGDETPGKFDASSSLDYFDVLNDCALRCFFASLAEPYRSSLLPAEGHA